MTAELATYAGCAERIGRSAQTVRRWAAAQLIAEAGRDERGRVLLDVNAVRELDEARRAGAAERIRQLGASSRLTFASDAEWWQHRRARQNAANARYRAKVRARRDRLRAAAAARAPDVPSAGPVSRHQAAVLAHRCLDTLRRWEREGALRPSGVDERGRPLFDAVDVVRIADERNARMRAHLAALSAQQRADHRPDPERLQALDSALALEARERQRARRDHARRLREITDHACRAMDQWRARRASSIRRRRERERRRRAATSVARLTP